MNNETHLTVRWLGQGHLEAAALPRPKDMLRRVHSRFIHQQEDRHHLVERQPLDPNIKPDIDGHVIKASRSTSRRIGSSPLSYAS